MVPSFSVTSDVASFTQGAMRIVAKADKAFERRSTRLAYFIMRDSRQNIRTRNRRSRPGEGPTNWTGLLRNKILFEYLKYQRKAVIGPIKANHSTHEITEALEFGRGNMEPRPYMRPAWRRQLAKHAPELLRNSITS